MADDPKTAAHRLLQEQRDALVAALDPEGFPSSQMLISTSIAIIDVLELQIRRIDELENP